MAQWRRGVGQSARRSLAIDHYATTTLKFHPDAAVLAKARSSLLGELSAASALRARRAPEPRPGARRDARRDAHLRDRLAGASLDLVAKLDTTVPLTVASMKKYYSTHTANYDTICVSVAVVDPTQITNFNEAQSEG